MVIGERLRDVRKGKNLSQGDIEKRTGLLRCYISRVENGHTVPSVETLEKLARAMEVPLYRLFYEGQGSPKVPTFPKRDDGPVWGSSGSEAVYLDKLRRVLGRVDERHRKLVLLTAQKMAGLGRRNG